MRQLTVTVCACVFPSTRSDCRWRDLDVAHRFISFTDSNNLPRHHTEAQPTCLHRRRQGSQRLAAIWPDWTFWRTLWLLHTVALEGKLKDNHVGAGTALLEQRERLVDVSIAGTRLNCKVAASFKTGGGRVLQGCCAGACVIRKHSGRRFLLSYTDIIGHTNEVWCTFLDSCCVFAVLMFW